MVAERFARSFDRDDHPNGPWDPVPVQTTIEFRDMQATYTFPVGVTTLWWYAPNQSNGKAKFVNANATAPAVHTDAAPVRVNATASAAGAAAIPHYTASVAWTAPVESASGADEEEHSEFKIRGARWW